MAVSDMCANVKVTPFEKSNGNRLLTVYSRLEHLPCKCERCLAESCTRNDILSSR